MKILDRNKMKSAGPNEKCNVQRSEINLFNDTRRIIVQSY